MNKIMTYLHFLRLPRSIGALKVRIAANISRSRLATNTSSGQGVSKYDNKLLPSLKRKIEEAFQQLALAYSIIRIRLNPFLN